MKTPTLAYWLHAFFHEWLAQQRNLSHNTVLSYRDTWRLFLRFVASRRQRLVADLAIENLTGEEVLAFLRHSEEERKVTIGTRNCRLAALRSFFKFVADREPTGGRPVCRSSAYPDQESSEILRSTTSMPRR